MRIRPSDNSSEYVEYAVQAPAINYIVTGLLANKSYKWNVMTLCDASGSIGSGWSTTSYFSTLGSGRLEETEISHTFDVQIFPNPTTGPLRFNFYTDDEVIVDAQLYNLMGQQVWNNQFIITEYNNNLSVDISSLTQGMYLLVLRKELEQISYKIIKH